MKDLDYYRPMMPIIEDTCEYRYIGSDFIDVKNYDAREILTIAPEGISYLTAQGFSDASFLLRTVHLQQIRDILDDPDSSKNDKFVAFDLLKNANIASGKILPLCQDTGTAIVIGKKGEDVWVLGDDERAIIRGIDETYQTSNLRYSQLAPISMYEEKDTGTNLPAQIEIFADKGNSYKFLFIAKGGGSANKTFLYQQTKAILNPTSLINFLEKEIKTIGTSACPPYHLAIVIGGTSAEFNLKTLKLASTRYLDGLPTAGNLFGQAFRDIELEKQVHKLTQDIGIGAQFGGKYFCHDVRVIRLPRHGGSCPIGIGVSCSADRQILGKITPEGLFLEKLETDPAQFLPDDKVPDINSGSITLDLDVPMDKMRSKLSLYPVGSLLSMSGTLVVARDIAHAKLKEQIDNGGDLPTYFKDKIVYYAGPAKTPDGLPSGAFGPTTASRMDPYIKHFQAKGGSLITMAKGNRSKSVINSCKKYGGFYLGSIGGTGAILAQNCIKSIDIIEFPELGMEAIWEIQVENFAAFIIIDDKGNDFYAQFFE
ncbi:MAG: Fumarate hydratase class I, aerobic [Alphaproteobacteria bacterium MarineAlpha3_Bin7]|nr:MAG: Fumarate hydratase class I, aerobic [Alphaproteobacteria bacterium MarineAlpha3_Bin7]|tara:strand:- start:1234 stop:2853 length:1620 start_codon:yes stop_codon:yes gene_type:complete